MAVLLMRYNDDPILRKQCKVVTEVNDKIRQHLDNMMDTLHSTRDGAALAANQVGLMWRLVVIDYFDTVIKMVNPTILAEDGQQLCTEGCLSFPNRGVRTLRPLNVTVEYLDEYGVAQTMTATGNLAKCFCHEIDHLNGIIFLDRQVQE